MQHDNNADLQAGEAASLGVATTPQLTSLQASPVKITLTSLSIPRLTDHVTSICSPLSRPFPSVFRPLFVSRTKKRDESFPLLWSEFSAVADAWQGHNARGDNFHVVVLPSQQLCNRPWLGRLVRARLWATNDKAPS